MENLFPFFLSCLLLLNFYINSEVAFVDQIYHINHIQTHIQFMSAVSEHQSLCGMQHSTHSILNMCQPIGLLIHFLVVHALLLMGIFFGILFHTAV